MAVSLISDNTQIQKLDKRETTFNSHINQNGIEIGYQNDKEYSSSDVEKINNKPKFTADITHHLHILKLIK